MEDHQFSHMLMMLQNIHQELLKKSFNFSPNSDLNANTENHQEFLQITPNSFPNSNSNPSSKNNPSKSFGYVPKLDFSVFAGTNSENPQADEYGGINQECLQITPNSLPHLNSNPCSETHPPKSEDSSKSVSQENDTREPILFTAISVCLNGNKVDQGFEEKIYVRGKTEDSLHKLYEPVQVWEFADKPRICYEECRRTLFIALNFVNILKWKLGLHGKFVWYKLSKILDVLEEKPPPDDLVAHKQLLEKAVEQDEGDGPGDDESIEWLWDIFWRFDGIFERLEHLSKSVEFMASIVVETGMIREAKLLLSVAEKQGILLACDDIYIGLVKGYVRAGELELAVSISSSCYRFVFGFLIEERKIECAVSVDEEAVQVEFGTDETRHLESLVGFSLFRWDDNRNQKTVTTGWKPRRVNSSKVANMYCEKRDFEEALKFFSKMKCAPSIVVVNRAIHLLCSHFGIGRADDESFVGFSLFWYLFGISMRCLRPCRCYCTALIRSMFICHMVESLT